MKIKVSCSPRCVIYSICGCLSSKLLRDALIQSSLCSFPISQLRLLISQTDLTLALQFKNKIHVPLVKCLFNLSLYIYIMHIPVYICFYSTLTQLSVGTIGSEIIVTMSRANGPILCIDYIV